MVNRITDRMLKQAQVQIVGIAKAHNITEAEVRTEMEAAMRAGMENPDPSVQEMWDKLTWRGPEPTVEEFIAWVTLMVAAGQNRGRVAG